MTNEVRRNGDPRSPDQGGVSVIFPIAALVQYLPLVLGAGLALGLLAGIQSLTTPRTFEVAASFVTEGGEARPVGAAGGILGQLGISVSGSGSDSPQFFADLLTSRELLLETLQRSVALPAADGGGEEVLIFEALGGENLTEPEEVHRAMGRLRSMVETSVSTSTGVVSVRVQSPSPEMAETVAVTLMELLNRFNLERRQTRASQERGFVDERATEQAAMLREAEAELQRFLRQNREFRNSPELLFEFDRLQREVNMRQQILTGLLESSERARIEEVRNLPVVTLIDRPEGAAEPRPRYTILRAIAGGLFGGLLAWFLALARLSWIRLREEEDPAVVELRGAWAGLRSMMPLSRRT